ncbi:MAG: tetratricopeptide repeat protein [Proteobacteria bacterium]|nr:tetratricopeptide repeat protein [Pseudomonadota bacterium]
MLRRLSPPAVRSGLITALCLAGCLVGVSLSVAPRIAHAQDRYADMPVAQAYQACLAASRRDPEAGFEAAIAWRDEGGGPPSLHCVALALFGLGQFNEAATRLEALAADMPTATTREQSAVLGQAGSVWLHAGDLSRAHRVLSQALELDSSNPEIWIDRGDALARGGEYWDAVDDFSAALDRDDARLDALIFRAAAYRLLEVPDLARDDIARALAVDPGNPDALMELGAVQAGVGEFDAARKSWLRVLSVAPESRAADAARAALQQMDVKVE